MRELLKSTHAEWQASSLQSKDQGNAVIQDTVLSYAELNNWEQRIGAMVSASIKDKATATDMVTPN